MRWLVEQLIIQAKTKPKKPAIILPDRVVTYEMLVSGIQSVQETIESLGFSKNKPIGIFVDNPARHLIIALALLNSGRPICSLRVDLLSEAVKIGIAEIITDQNIRVEGMSGIQVEDDWFYHESRGLKAFKYPQDFVARIVFTSGSTGRPKAIAWSSEILIKRIQDCIRLDIATSERVFCCYGLSTPGFYFALTQLTLGKSVVFSPLEDALSQIKLLRVDEIICSQTQIRALLNELHLSGEVIKIPKIKVGCGQLSYEFQSEIEKSFGSEVINTYSATEFGFAGLSSGIISRLKDNRGSRFLPLTEIEVSHQNGDPVAFGHEGLIKVRSRYRGWPFLGICSLYKPVISDWIDTGDLGFMVEGGLFVVTGRNDELINDGGIRFSPEAIEEVLRKHPNISDVAAVRFGEQNSAEPWIAIVAKREISLEELNKWIGESVAGELGGVRFRRRFLVEKLPYTGNGKIARQELRSMLARLKERPA